MEVFTVKSQYFSVFGQNEMKEGFQTVQTIAVNLCESFSDFWRFSPGVLAEVPQTIQIASMLLTYCHNLHFHFKFLK